LQPDADVASEQATLGIALRSGTNVGHLLLASKPADSYFLLPRAYSRNYIFCLNTLYKD
jgi:hypothetical protein